MLPAMESGSPLGLFASRNPCVFCVLCVGLALALRMILDPWLGSLVPYPLFLVAAVISGMYAGPRAGICVAALGGLAADYFLIPPRLSLGFASFGYLLGFLEYALAAAAIIWLSNSNFSAWRQIRQTMLQLCESEEQQRIALAAANMGTWSWDVESDRVMWDAECRRLFGLREEIREADLATFLSLLHADDREQSRQALRDAAARNADYDETHRVVWADGTLRWLRCRGRPWVEGKRRLMVGVSLDVTSAKKAEEAMQANERLAGAARLASALAHEINNPLNIVVNALYLLGKSPIEASAQPYWAAACEATDRVSRITEHLLQLYPGRPALLRRFSLRDVLEEVIRGFEKNARHREISFVRRFRCEGEIEAAQEDIRHLAFNMLMNCAENLADGGRVVISLSTCTDSRSPVPCVRLVFADNGPGIPPEMRNRLFEPFVTTKDGKATGLGLWACRGILNQYGWTLRYRTSTAPGRSGTCFAVYLRRAVFSSNRVPAVLAAKPAAGCEASSPPAA